MGMRVEIVERERGRETVVAVRAARSKRVLWAGSGLGVLGAALCMVEAVSYAAGKGHVIVSAPGRVEAARVSA